MNKYEQIIITPDNDYASLKEHIAKGRASSLLLVCGGSGYRIPVFNAIEDICRDEGLRLVCFDGFSPNPRYEDITSGIELFKNNGCDMIIGLGGGSAMDVAKSIRHYSESRVPMLAIPTTAGTGSESTRFAVIYRNGEKVTVDSDACYPDAILLDPSLLEGLPLYQRKATFLDALGHAIESYWSVNSTEESRKYAHRAIEMALDNYRGYIGGDKASSANMLEAANIAGRAINISKTTAGHAMCYKLTTVYGLAHGHSVACCLSVLWDYMKDNVDRCIDPRGGEYLLTVFGDIASAFGCEDFSGAGKRFTNILKELELDMYPVKLLDIPAITGAVNVERLGNHPIALSPQDIEALYSRLVRS